MDGHQQAFYKEKHPLLRLIDFKTGVVNGAIITQEESDVIVIIDRIFTNKMEYIAVKKPEAEGYWLLKEKLTDSTVRVFTDDKMLTEAFWNNYNANYTEILGN